jgi:DNA polymerase-3 subunit gamma/tau
VSQVLALKYRPSTFDKLIGQETITQTLTHALEQDRLSHAYLFSGLRGSGKTSTARIFAKALICDNGPTATPCEVCENCTLANESRHIDIIEMDAASSRKIDDIRNLIEQTKYKPNMARFKIFIIDEVHMLTKEAFNALLKTLEEPPSYVKFILATTDPMKLPATILSRTQHFRFKKIHNTEVVKHLSHILNLENIDFETEALSMLSRAGNGSLRDTLTLLDQAIIFSKKYVDAKSVASMLGILDPELLDALIQAIFKNDRAQVIEFIKELENYESEIVIDELIAFIKERFFAEDARFSTLLADRFFRILSESKAQLFLNADSGFVLTLLFFKMMEATKIKEIDIMIEELESKITLTPQAVAPTATPKAQTKDEKDTPSPSPAPVQKEIIEEKKEEDYSQNFAQLIAKLYDRHHPLGECFEKNVAFISFHAHELTLSSSASGECSELLRHSSGVIRHFIHELFSLNTKLVMKRAKPKEIPTPEPMSDNETTSSMIEDVELEEATQNIGNSCVENQVIAQESKEIDRGNILEDPFVKKAGELFEPSKIIVKSKV